MIFLFRNLPYLGWTENLNALQETVVPVIVGHYDVALLLLRQHKLHIILNVGSRFLESGINVASSEVDDVEAVLQVAHHMGNLLVRFLLLIDGNELYHAERRDVKPLARQRKQVAQTVVVLLELCVTAVAANEHVGIYEDVIGVEEKGTFRHRLECKIRELCLFLFGEFVHLAGHPHAEQEVDEFLAFQSILLEQKFKYAPALFLHLFLFFAHDVISFLCYWFLIKVRSLVAFVSICKSTHFIWIGKNYFAGSGKCVFLQSKIRIPTYVYTLCVRRKADGSL